MRGRRSRTWGSRRRLWREVFSMRRAGWRGCSAATRASPGTAMRSPAATRWAPEGVQVAFVQQGGSLAQTATLSAGQYTVSFKAAQRGNYQLGAQAIEVRVDGVAVGQYQAPTTAYGAYQTAPFAIASTGAHTLALVGVGSGGADFTGFIDDVRIGAPVAPAATTTGLASSANPAVAGVSVTFTATVTGAAPTGVVQFFDNGAVIGGCGAVALAGSGNSRTATCSTGGLAVGTRTITASYGGDGVNAGSSSSALSQVMNAGRRSRTWGSRRRRWRRFSVRAGRGWLGVQRQHGHHRERQCVHQRQSGGAGRGAGGVRAAGWQRFADGEPERGSVHGEFQGGAARQLPVGCAGDRGAGGRCRRWPVSGADDGVRCLPDGAVRDCQHRSAHAGAGWRRKRWCRLHRVHRRRAHRGAGGAGCFRRSRDARAVESCDTDAHGSSRVPCDRFPGPWAQ
ncbi:MAG: Ig-like domain repeat protein [Betaproteobacteria bacterium]|nr:Ig-like domain repeat protein [Betaproteobacteria bacterium]